MSQITATSLLEELGSLQEERKRLKADLSFAKSENQRLLRENGVIPDHEKRAADAKDKAAKARAGERAARGEVDAVARARDEARADAADLRVRFDAAKAKKEELSAALAVSQGQRAQCVRDCERLTAENQNLRKQLAEASAKASAAADLKAALGRL